MLRPILIAAAGLGALGSSSASGQAQDHAQVQQPRVIGARWMPHDRVIPVTGHTVGSLLQASRQVPPTRDDTRRERRGWIDWAALERLDPALPSNRVTLPVFDGEVLELVFFHRETRGETSYTWFGTIAGIALSDVVLVREEDVVHATVRDYFGGRTWILRWDASGEHALRELETQGSSQGQCATDRETVTAGPAMDLQPTGGGSGSLALGSTEDPPNLVDILFVATNEALADFGNASAFRAGAEVMIADFNMRSANSAVPVALRLSGIIASSGYSENADGGVDLDRITDDGDGFLDEVHDVRDDARADLVALIREDEWDGDCILTGCTEGVAWRPSSLTDMSSGTPNGFEGGFGFSVTSLHGDSARTFSHEIGHNFGACHDVAQGGCSSSITSAARGIVRECEDIFGAAICAHTTMAYAPDCFFGTTAIPYWSTVGVTVQTSFPAPVCTLPMWDDDAQVSNLINTSRATLSQNRIGATLKWSAAGASAPAANGTLAYPFPTVAASVGAVQGGIAEGVVRVNAGTYDDTGALGGPVTLANPCRIEPEGGSVRIE